MFLQITYLTKGAFVLLWDGSFSTTIILMAANPLVAKVFDASGRWYQRIFYVYGGSFFGCFAAAITPIGIMNCVNSRNLKHTKEPFYGNKLCSCGRLFSARNQAVRPANAPPLGRYGMMHKAYLKEHKPILYTQLLLSERLYPLCREIDEAATTRLRTIPDEKAAHKIILFELVYD